MVTGVNETDLSDSAFWILTALATGRNHGYALIRTVEDLSAGVTKLKATTLYSVLDRLSESGLINSDGDEIVGGRVRRHFVMTAAGEERLAVVAEHLEAKARSARVQIAARSALAHGATS
jgi:PadR family transcriptional regulator PadR